MIAVELILGAPYKVDPRKHSLHTDHHIVNCNGETMTRGCGYGTVRKWADLVVRRLNKVCGV